MHQNRLFKFFSGIILPAILAIIMFMVAFYAIMLPSLERNMMNGKKEMIHQLTSTAHSLAMEFFTDARSGLYSEQEAKKLAAKKIGQLRYGMNKKEYFWIIDKQPVMIMHPYQPELNGTDLNNYTDPDGTPLFVEAVKLVEEKGEGFIHYRWQWHDDSTRVVPKISYVKELADWDWIIGTGIYLDDVHSEIKALKRNLIHVSLLITTVIILIIFYIIRQSLRIERQREKAEGDLKLSREKYKSLVEASREGTLMLLDDKVVFANLKLSEHTGFSVNELQGMHLSDIFKMQCEEITSLFKIPQKSVSFEAEIRLKTGDLKEVVLTISKIKINSVEGYIIVVKNVSRKEQIEQLSQQLSSELQTSLMMMNQSIEALINDFVLCDLNLPVARAVELMERKGEEFLFVKHNSEIIGWVSMSDISRRMLKAGADAYQPVVTIMNSPVVLIDRHTLVYEAVLKMRKHGVRCMLVNDDAGNYLGKVGYVELLELQQNNTSYLVKEIQMAETVDQLKKLNNKLPVLMEALVRSGENAENFTRVRTSVSDAVCERLIELAIEHLGSAPCRFAFMALGSEGRMEQTMATDQDNAIVFEDNCADEAKVKNYFHQLAAYVNARLNDIGYKYCIGEVMAQNAQWTQALSVWKGYFTDWMRNSDPQAVLNSSIFFDLRCIAGDKAFVDELHGHIQASLDGKAVFLHNMAQSVSKFKLPTNIFGGLVSSSEKDATINIKKVMMPLTAFARLYSLQQKITEVNTPQRLKALAAKNAINNAQLSELQIAYNTLMVMRFKYQLREIKNNEPADNEVSVSELTQIELTTLKRIFTEIQNVITKTQIDFRTQ